MGRHGGGRGSSERLGFGRGPRSRSSRSARRRTGDVVPLESLLRLCDVVLLAGTRPALVSVARGLASSDVRLRQALSTRVEGGICRGCRGEGGGVADRRGGRGSGGGACALAARRRSISTPRMLDASRSGAGAARNALDRVAAWSNAPRTRARRSAVLASDGPGSRTASRCPPFYHLRAAPARWRGETEPARSTSSTRQTRGRRSWRCLPLQRGIRGRNDSARPVRRRTRREPGGRAERALWSSSRRTGKWRWSGPFGAAARLEELLVVFFFAFALFFLLFLFFLCLSSLSRVHFLVLSFRFALQ